MIFQKVLQKLAVNEKMMIVKIIKHLITITKTYLYNFDPLKPNFCIVKLGFTGVYNFFFLFLLKNIDCGYSLELPCRGGSNEYPQSMFLIRNNKNIRNFHLQIFIFLVVKFSVYLNRHVFVMNGKYFNVKPSQPGGNSYSQISVSL